MSVGPHAMPHYPTNEEFPFVFKALSIDGGGIRGVIPAVVLDHIETATGKPMSELFDLMVGTSTGGIIAVALAAPAAPRYSAADVLALYKDHGREIFHRSFWQGVVSVAGAFDERYDAAPLERLLKRYLGDSTLADCLITTVVPSYDIERREPYFFKSERARLSKDRNHYLRDAARATSAAPTYFRTRREARRTRRTITCDSSCPINATGNSSATFDSTPH